MKKHLATVATLATLLTFLVAFVWESFATRQQVQENSKAISVFTIDKIDKRLDYLKDKEKKQGKLHPQDRDQKRELERLKKSLECKVYQICK